jgi:hypothetical protein
VREWLVIEDSRKNGVFAPDEAKKPKGFIPRDVAERVLGRRMDSTQWFTREECDLMRAQPEWTNTLDCPEGCDDPIGCFQNERCRREHGYDPMRVLSSPSTRTEP